MGQFKGQADLEQLLLLETDDLYIELGKGLSRKTMGMHGSSPEKNRMLGQNWFASQQKNLSSSICTNERVRIYLSDGRLVNTIELASLIADILSAQYTGIPVFALSALIVKTGLGFLCKEED
jgi:hypothetical protein